jgi:branched-chain amino acid aminotransferase
MPGYAFLNKQIIPLSDAKVGIMTHALHYGTACFDGIRGNWNSEEEQLYLFRLKDHYERLRQSCHIIKIDLPYTVEELCQLTIELVERNGYQEDVYIRPLAYKSSQTVGVRLHNLEDDLLIFVIPFGPYLDIEKGVRCCVSNWRRIDDNMIPPRAKVAGMYANSALAKTEAWESGFDEAIFLNQDGHVSEGSGENLFLAAVGRLVTPPSSDNILVGITRDSIIKLAKEELGIETVERQIGRSELYVAEECFLTGTAAHVTPVVEIDHRKIGSGEIGEISKKLQALYFEVIKGRNARYVDWCTPAYRQPAKIS